MASLRAAQSARGDYLGSMRGDPGIFGFLGKVAGTALGIAGKVLPGPIGGIARFAGGLITRRAQPPAIQRAPAQLQYGRQAGPGGIKVPGFVGGMQRLVPGGATGYYAKRRRMNPGNVKALRRAMRRQDAFVKLARRALRGSKYKVTTVGSSRSRPLNIRESGPGGVTVNR